MAVLDLFGGSGERGRCGILLDVNPYESTELEEPVGLPLKSRARFIRRALLVSIGLTTVLFIYDAYFSSRFVAILLGLSVLLMFLISATSYGVMLSMAIGTRRCQPGIVGLLAGGLTLALTASLSFPPAVRIILIPLTVAALSGSEFLRDSDWELVGATRASVGEWCCIVAACALGAWIGVKRGVGKPILLILDQDVVGTTRSEQIEIAVVGGVAVAGFSLVISILAISAFWPRPPRNDTGTDAARSTEP